MMRKRNGKSSKGGADPEQHQNESLSAKNSRLAKELSELRVRQREEAKNVSRLTMENVSDVIVVVLALLFCCVSIVLFLEKMHLPQPIFITLLV